MGFFCLLGVVYAVEFSHRSGRDLVNMAKKRTNVVPIIADARKPLDYRLLVINKYFYFIFYRWVWLMLSLLMWPNLIRLESWESTLNIS